VQSVREEGGPVVKVERSDISKSPAQVKKISPFRNVETGDQPGMPGLSPVAGDVRRGQGQGPAPATVTATDHVHREIRSVRRSGRSPDDLGLYRSAIGDVRKQAVDILNYLVRYDDSLTLKQAEQLTYCTITIQQAAEP
jgi:hypothetical protein